MTDAIVITYFKANSKGFGNLMNVLNGVDQECVVKCLESINDHFEGTPPAKDTQKLTKVLLSKIKESKNQKIVSLSMRVLTRL